MLPREKLLRHGVQALSTEELLVLILGSGGRAADVFSLAKLVLRDKDFFHSPRSLMRIKGVGVAKACAVAAAGALADRLSKGVSTPAFLEPSQVFAYFSHLRTLKQEHVYGLYVDTRKKLLHEQLLFKGTVDATVVHPRDIFRHALESNASGVIIVHNHPSGDCDPSDEDLLFTERLLACGELLHVPLLDHIIVGKTYWSWAEHYAE